MPKRHIFFMVISIVGYNLSDYPLNFLGVNLGYILWTFSVLGSFVAKAHTVHNSIEVHSMSDSPNTDKQSNMSAACFRCRGFRY